MRSAAPSTHVLTTFGAEERELARRAEPVRADLSGEYERIVALVLSLVERSP